MSPRLRTLLLWGLFLLAAGAAAFAVHRLHDTTQREIALQSALTVQRTHEFALRIVQDDMRDARQSVFLELSGFHVDGLGSTLRRWDAASEIIAGTFQWEAGKGFDPESVWPSAAPPREQVAALWGELRRWRQAHPRDRSWGGTVLALATLAYRAVDNPALSTTSPRYQEENLDLLRDAGRTADPWVGWAANLNVTGQYWVIWYQAGPDEPVRGCFMDVRPLLPALRERLSASGAMKIALREEKEMAEHSSDALLLMDLPGYVLHVEPGELLKRKASEAQLTALIAALLLGLFLLGAAALGFRTWREARDAGRKITFVTQVSHELRTPLTSIRMFADLLAAPGLAEEKRLKFAGTIGAESSRLGALIERLLAFNTLEQGGRPIACGPVAVDAVVREVVEEMKATLGAAGLQPGVELPATPAVVLSDHSTLKQALLNLLDNACKYAPGSGALKISVAPAGAQVVLRVSDRGPGIPADVRSRLFEPFVQGGSTLTTKSPGVGLGLSLARGLLRQAGATLELIPGATGATFEIRLPAAPVNPPSRP